MSQKVFHSITETEKERNSSATMEQRAFRGEKEDGALELENECQNIVPFVPTRRALFRRTCGIRRMAQIRQESAVVAAVSQA